ncbi:DUF2264 domain-containing protein [Catenovulum sp. SX2]|uniref:DUF2264 domain-containing protein n=1 Tax=Catenovulum sp. SX2 TaxID=3398614 RepID=UPI003F86D7D0
MFNVAVNLLRKFKPVDGWHTSIKVPKSFSNLDRQVKELGDKAHLTKQDYQQIFTYFIEGINAYRCKYNCRVTYPGIPGTRGIKVEGLEGFARSAPMLAAWLYGQREQKIKLTNEDEFDILAHLAKGIEHGCDPKSPAYWGDFADYDQRAVEAGDIAVTVWILQQIDSTIFDKQVSANVIGWLKQINNIKLYGGNWCLFKLIVNALLEQLTDQSYEEVENSYKTFKSYYVGNGWFGDGAKGFVDYYNVWQMQYYLYWFHLMKPDYDASFLQNVFSEFSEGFKFFISPNGAPIFGRSACYRLAIPSPLIINSAVNNKEHAVSKRALEAIWIHFIKNGALQKGTVTQGYYESQPQILENYSGRGSALWCVRSLTLAFMQSNMSTFWSCEPGLLPVEMGDFEQLISKPGFKLVGKQQDLSITLVRSNTYFSDKHSHASLPRLNLFRKVLQFVLRRPLRSEHLNIKYGREKYVSNKFFCD